MPFTNFPFGITSFGVPVMPSAPTTGAIGVNGPSGSNIFYVNSATTGATDGSGFGTTPQAPFKTINFAVTQCKANNNDVIYVGPQHVETVSAAAGLTIGVAGVNIIGQGQHSDRAQINFTTSTAATVTITAANVFISGLRILNSIDARVDGLIISAADCQLFDIEWFDGVGTSSLISVRTTAAGTRLRMYKCMCYFSENTGTQRTEFIRIVGGGDHQFLFCYSDVGASFSTAVFNNVTTAFVGCIMADCYFANGHASAVAAAFVATTTGLMVDRADFLAQGISSVTLPNAGGYSIDGDSVLTTPAHQATPVQGSTGAFQKSIVSSTIPQAPSVVTFITCTGGSVLVEGGTSETDGTGLAGGTNFQLLTNNANGLTGTGAPLAAETVANLGANKTVDLTAASVTALRKGFVLESGKLLQANSTVAACTGAGKIFLNLTYRVLSGAPVLS